MHRTRWNLCRRLNAILLLADGQMSLPAVSRLTAAAQSSDQSLGELVHLVHLEGLKASLGGTEASTAICSHLGSITAVDQLSTGARISALALEYRTDGANSNGVGA